MTHFPRQDDLRQQRNAEYELVCKKSKTENLRVSGSELQTTNILD